MLRVAELQARLLDMDPTAFDLPLLGQVKELLPTEAELKDVWRFLEASRPLQLPLPPPPPRPCLSVPSLCMRRGSLHSVDQMLRHSSA